MRLIAWFAFTSLAAAVLLGSCVTPQSERQNALVLPSEVVSSQAESNGYAGPQACAQCHSKNYNDYRASAHPKKLRPAAEARAFGVPLPPGWEWKDISYVIGGARWKARYVDLQGYIVTSTGIENRKRVRINTTSQLGASSTTTPVRSFPMTAVHAIPLATAKRGIRTACPASSELGRSPVSRARLVTVRVLHMLQPRQRTTSKLTHRREHAVSAIYEAPRTRFLLTEVLFSTTSSTTSTSRVRM